MIEEREIPAAERRGFGGTYILALLCKQDKEQLDRIEKMLRILTGLDSSLEPKP